MQVSELLSGAVVTVEAHDSLADAATEMEDNGLSAVAVCEGGVLVGILTPRDIVRAVADGTGLEETVCEEYMTAAPVTLRGSAEALEALRLMLDGGFRHIPVLDSDEDITGILELSDLARVLAVEKREATSAG